MRIKAIIALGLSCLMILVLFGCKAKTEPQKTTAKAETSATEESAASVTETSAEASTEATAPTEPDLSDEEIYFNGDWDYAEFSQIHTASPKLYRSKAENRKNKVICVNAGHGCKGGSSKKTLCHPDGSPKVTGGSTAKGSIKATSINEGMTFLDGSQEADVNLALAKIVKQVLLEGGYDVLMLRESDDAQLDNIARTVIANEYADCHISLHYDSTESDKGLFFTGVPNVASYRNMEPVKSHYKEHTKLGEALIEGEKAAGVKIYSSGRIDVDLTQTSYSTVASVDLEVGDKASDHSPAQHKKIADGILNGLDIYFNS